MVTVSERDGTITYASPATERVSGFTPEEFMARDPFDLMHPEDRPRYREALEKLSDNPGMSLDLEHRVRHKDGTWRWVEGTFKSLLGDPEVGGLVATVRDVTERKRRESNAAFLVDLVEGLARPSSPDEIVRAAGERTKRHFGVSRLTFAVVDEAADEVTAIYDNREQGLVGAVGTRRLSDYASEDCLREFKAGRPIAINGSNTDPRTAARAYESFRVRAQLMAPHVTDGRLDFVIAMQRPAPHEWRADEVGLLQELAERIYSRLEHARAEETLRESGERYRALFDSIDEGFGIVEMLYDERGRAVDYRILETNPAFGRMTGFADAAGKTALELNPEAEPYWFETLGGVAQTGEDVRFESYADALDRWFDVYASRVGGQGSRRVAIVFANTT
jgi:PAS domain S-box-containing protein